MMHAIYLWSAFIGTFLSVTLLSYFSWRRHDPLNPKTLSELAAQNQESVKWFRTVLWVCGTFFALTMYGFVIPSARNGAWLFIAWTVNYACELLLAIFPASGNISRLLHNVFAYAMSIAMLVTAGLLSLSISRPYSYVTEAILITMSALGLLTIFDRKRFIFYELPFIYLSHISILVGVIAFN